MVNAQLAQNKSLDSAKCPIRPGMANAQPAQIKVRMVLTASILPGIANAMLSQYTVRTALLPRPAQHGGCPTGSLLSPGNVDVLSDLVWLMPG